MTREEQKSKHGTGTVYQYDIKYNGGSSIKLWADSEDAAISRLKEVEKESEVKVEKVRIKSSLIYYTK